MTALKNFNEEFAKATIAKMLKNIVRGGNTIKK